MSGWTRVPNAALDRLDTLGCVAIKVYLRLCRCARKNGSCIVLRFTLAKQIGVTDRAITKALAELRDAGLITDSRKQHGSIFRISHWPVRRVETGTSIPVLDARLEQPFQSQSSDSNNGSSQTGTAVPGVQDFLVKTMKEKSAHTAPKKSRKDIHRADRRGSGGVLHRATQRNRRRAFRRFLRKQGLARR